MRRAAEAAQPAFSAAAQAADVPSAPA